MQPKLLMHTLADLDKKAQELDEALQNARFEIHNVLWDLMELKDFAESKNADKTNANS